MVPSSASSGALGLPGRSSTRKPPSRNTRARMRAVASRCTGRASSLICIVTTVVWPGPLSMSTTAPTVMPAIRTGEPSRSPFELWNTACTR